MAFPSDEWPSLSCADFEIQYRPLSEELIFLQAVADGNMALVQENISRQRFNDKSGLGILSADPLRNIRYHFVVTVALVSRCCINAGMTQMQAFHLSDTYIQRMDQCTSAPEVIHLHTQMVVDYTRRMQLIHYPSASRQVTRAIGYIYEHITERITVKTLSQTLNTSSAYLSHLFAREIGIPVSDFIRKLKIEYAKNLLQFTQDEMAEIAAHLSFSSQSHFIQRFREETGMTPKAFRESHSSAYWPLVQSAQPCASGDKAPESTAKKGTEDHHDRQTRA